MKKRVLATALVLGIITALSLPALLVEAADPIEVGSKEWVNTWTETEYLGGGRYGATIYDGHQVFFDEVDGNKPKKHKLTDSLPDSVTIQSAQVSVEIHPFYATFYDVQHQEVRLEEEHWVVQRLFKAPDEWRDVDAYSPAISVSEYSEPAGDVVLVTVVYITDYGLLTVEYLQRDGSALKHNVYFQNTSGSTQTFRVVQKWTGIAGSKVNNRDIPVDIDAPYLAFHDADKPAKEFTISENLYSMVYNPDGTEKIDQCLQTPITVETSASGLKADFIYGNWVLGNNETLEIDPDTATLNNPNEDGLIEYTDGPTYTRYNGQDLALYGGQGWMGFMWLADYRAYVEWDISSIAGGTLTANPVFKYHGSSILATDGEINSLTEEQPSSGGCTDEELYGYIATGAAYVNPFDIELGETKQIDLGASAKTDLQAVMTAEQAWWAIGFQSPADEGTMEGGFFSSFYAEEYATANPKPTLYVEYTAVVPPLAPSDFTLRDLGGITISANWTAPDNATGYLLLVNRDDYPTSANSTLFELAYSGNMTSANLTRYALGQQEFFLSLWAWNNEGYSENYTTAFIGGDGGFISDFISEEDMEVVGEELANLNIFSSQVLAFLVLASIVALAFWRRERLLYVLAGLALLGYGVIQFGDNIYIGLVLIVLGIYCFAKAAWDRKR